MLSGAAELAWKTGPQWGWFAEKTHVVFCLQHFLGWVFGPSLHGFQSEWYSVLLRETSFRFMMES